MASATEGFRIVLSSRIPLLVRRHLRGEVAEFLDGVRLAGEPVDVGQLEFFALHPGGTKVLDNLRDVFELEEAAVRHSREVLRDYGNLSSASVLFVAARGLAAGSYRPGALGLLLAMGPGFTAELLLVRAR
ncbi:MAG: 3-oxoacyl-[acyl-carrier-protein] synthase III C-terminal domain-containing protein [Planctomycetota bacterium]